MNIRKNKLVSIFVTIALVGVGISANALPNVTNGAKRGTATSGIGLRGTAALCDQASAKVDLDINNVRTQLMNGGDMWYDRGAGTAKYEVPKGSGKSSLFAGSIWVGGYDEQNNLKVCAQTYRQTGNDYWPGPLDLQTATIDKSVCSEWDKIWKVTKSDLLEFVELAKANGNTDDQKYNDIKQWPAAGNTDATGKSGNVGSLANFLENKSGQSYAPFVDVNSDGKYDWRNGDYPDILGDQYTWWVFNDAGGVKTETQTGTIGMEIQTSAFAFSTKDYMNDATFINYRLINRGTLNLNKTYMATWTDADLGYAYDDYIGCDTQRSLGILYNATTPDGFGDVASYGDKVPMVGVDFFIGPKKDTFINGVYQVLDTLGMAVFNYFNNGTGPTGNPSNGNEIYRLITGYNKQGDPIRDDRAAGPSSTGFGPGPETKFVYPGNPNNSAEWSQCQCGIPYGAIPDGDRRFIHSSGPFTLYSGGIVNDITIGAVWVADVGGCGTATFGRIRAADDLAQSYFNDGFRTIQKPNAPDLTIREGDRELIFYITNNNPVSNNYKEKYGRDTARQFRESTSFTRNFADSLYKFEGYRVFQLKNSTITGDKIFGLNGEVDESVAYEVFQSDIKNGVGTITNYTRNPDKGTGTGNTVYDAAVKVKGNDAGLEHSFKLTEDHFASGSDKRLVNYKTYYFIATAYAYNNFKSFQYSLPDSTQNEPYIESKTNAGGKPITVQAAIPNPTNGNMGTTVGAGYGDGIDIQLVEGLGNGRNAISMIQSSEDQVVNDPYIAIQPTYAAGTTPVDVKVIDPRSLKAMDFEIWLNGPIYSDVSKGIVDSLGSWTLKDKSNGQVLYTETNLSKKNDAILAAYGLAVTIQQGRRPGDNQIDGNGYISSSVTFSDPGKLWLAGINDIDGPTPQNWIKSGGSPNDPRDTTVNGCSVKNNNRDTSGQFYEKLFSNNDLLKASWAPYALASNENQGKCGFGVTRTGTPSLVNLESVDIIFTSDKSKWTRCPVIELNDDVNLAQGGAPKHRLRRHKGWNKDLDGSGNPIYSSDPVDSGMSYFPGYAISQTTGRRLNVVFGEDSYLKNQHGNDMIWNPTSDIFDDNNNVIFGGKHYIYILNSTYDMGKHFMDSVRNPGPTPIIYAYNRMMWVGLPRLTPGFNLLSLNDGLIPTETRLKIRVESPYRAQSDLNNVRNGGLPIFGFSTKGIAPKGVDEAGNLYNGDKQTLLDKIRMVPNPYYAYAGYEKSRLDTRVRITNLPNRATINIYSLDGTLIRRIEHVNTVDNTQGYEDWDIRNAKGLQIAGGMYLVHVKAEGIGETVIKWFGAMRPTDIVNY